MILNELRFEYSISQRGFTDFKYWFSVDLDSKEKNVLIEGLKSHFKKLEEILDGEISEDFKKEGIGNITQNEVSFGYSYQIKGLLTFLKCHLRYSGEKVENIEIGLYNPGNDSERLLKIYDRIIGLDGLSINPKLNSTINIINQLRKGIQINNLLDSI